MKKFNEDIPESLPNKKQNPWNKSKCKKNSDGKHVMQFIKTNKFYYHDTDGKKYLDMAWEDWKCEKCGKKEQINLLGGSVKR